LLCVRGVGRSPWPGFKSRPTQFCVTGSEDRVLGWVWVPFRVRSVGRIVVSIAAFKAVNPGSIPSQHSFVLQVLKTESYHEFESHSVSKVRWYSGEHSCLQSNYPEFDSRPMQFCVTGSEDRVLSWVPVLLLTLWLFATASIQILVCNVIHYVPVVLPSHHLQVHKNTIFITQTEDLPKDVHIEDLVAVAQPHRRQCLYYLKD
jgi:hypothetical protein